MSESLNKLKRLLAELFQIDRADLDFGIYRIMNAKRDEITRFLDNDLLPQVQDAFREYRSADRATLQSQLDEAIEQAKKLGADPETLPRVKELRQMLAGAVDVTSLENEVYSHLYNFFRRYYSEGDFISLRRYKEGVYAIPYEGEEVKLHWANHDQYYIKTSENFRNYSFKLPSGKRVTFKIVEAEAEKDNIKAASGNERRFLLGRGLGDKETGGHGDRETRGQGEIWDEIDDELVIYFRFVPDPQKRKQSELNAEAVGTLQSLFTQSPGLNVAWSSLFEKRPTEKNPERTLLEKHLNDYTARNTFDYFIHKDLGVFLRRELDFYIKNEVMHLDDIESETAPRVEQYLSKIKVIRKIAHKLIEFLAQLENFQKKLWLKKKFVVETNYCVTLDRVPEELYPEIAANEAQREEWVKLFAIDEIKGDLAGAVAYSEPLTVEFLKANPFLVIDTKHFGQNFKNRLLASFEDVEEQCDGLLISGENFQALELINPSYRGKVSGIYIDPPYNTDATEIVYKNGYKDSSWASLMCDRLLSSQRLLSAKGVLCCTIDDCEVANLSKIIEQAMSEYALRTVIIEYNHRGRVKSNFAVTHEYALWAIRKEQDLITRRRETSEDIRRNLRRTGTDSTREASPRQFYGIEVDNETLKIVSATEPLPLGSDIPDHANPKTTMVWPIDDQGVERRWYYSRERVLEEAEEGSVWAKRIAVQFKSTTIKRERPN